MSREIRLTRGEITIVDDEDYDYLSQWKWHLSNYGYVVRSVKRAGRSDKVVMHRDLVHTPDGMRTDHINGNKLDNRRANLRVVTAAQSNMNRGLFKNNRCGFKGVRPTSSGRYEATLQRGDGSYRHLGTFSTPEEAARAFDRAAKEAYGQFARLNLPEEA